MDGTLLRPDATVSGRSVELLNDMIGKGVDITVATARSAGSALHILRKIDIRLPVVLQNGVLLYDMEAKRYLDKKTLPPETVKEVFRTIDRADLDSFVYVVKDQRLEVYHRPLRDASMKAFQTERITRYGKRFTELSDLSVLAGECDVVYVSLRYPREVLDPLHEAVREIPGIKIEYYSDVYTERLYYYEIFHESASKKSAVEALRARFGYERVVGFGDNKNDLPLFAACDEGYAVENAREELKRAATAVIGPNTGDSVAYKIKELSGV